MKKKILYSDICAGIGGMRISLKKALSKNNLNSVCVFSSEISKDAKKVYEGNFNETPSGDITEIKIDEIPYHDILISGFPCQPFSSAGKKLGLKDMRTQPIFSIIEILKNIKPKVFLLENVKGLIDGNNRYDFNVIISMLKGAGYEVQWKLINSLHYVPQSRKRIYIVGIKSNFFNRKFKQKKLTKIFNQIPSKKSLAYVRRKFYKIEKAKDGNAHIKIYKGYTYTLTASMAVSGNVPVIYENNVFRKLTPGECLKLMGFPKDFKLNVSDAKAYKLIGNSVVVPALEDILDKIIKEVFR